MFIKSTAALLFTLAATPVLAWSDTAPHNPNAMPPQPVTNMANYCPPGLAPAYSGENVFCAGTPTFQFYETDNVPAGYTGRVFLIGPGAGYQTLSDIGM